MKKNPMRLLGFLLMAMMMVSLFAVGAFAEDTANVAAIGDTEYATLAAAIDAAESGATVTLLKDVTLSQKLTIKNDVTIEGAHTITRGDAYTGTLFVVNKGASLTLKGITVDGNNNWTFLEEEYQAAVKSGKKVSESAVRYTVYEEGAPVANKNQSVVTANGNVTLDGATFKNHVGSTLFYVASDVTLTMNDAIITHNTRDGSSVVADIQSGATWNIQGNTEITYNHNHAGNGTLSYMKGTVNMDGGLICNNSGVNNNGSVFMLYGSKAKMVMNGGQICHNWALQGSTNGWNCVLYIYGNGSTFEMNGGVIEENHCTQVPGIANNGTNANVTLNGGTIQNNVSYINLIYKDVYMYCDVAIGEDMVINGTMFAYRDVVNDGTINGNVYFYSGNTTYTGNGTVNGDLVVNSTGTAVITSGTWDGEVIVKDGGNLTITGGIYTQDVNEYVAPGYYAYHDEATGRYIVGKSIKLVTEGSDEIRYFTSITEAVMAAKATEGKDTIYLLADHKEAVALFDGMTLDLQSFTLEAEAVFGTNGSYITGDVCKGADSGARLIVAKNAIALGQNAPSTGRGYVMPVWDAAANDGNGAFVFAELGIGIEEGEFEEGTLGVQFDISGSSYVKQNLLIDQASSGLHIEVVATWTENGETVTQIAHLNDAAVSASVLDKCSIKAYVALEGHENLTISVRFVTKAGVVISSTPKTAQ